MDGFPLPANSLDVLKGLYAEERLRGNLMICKKGSQVLISPCFLS